MKLQFLYELNVLTKCVNLHGHIIQLQEGFLKFFSYKILTCEYVLALEKLFDQSIYKNPRLLILCLNDYKCISHFWFKSEFWNPEPVTKFQARSIKPVYRYWKNASRYDIFVHVLQYPGIRILLHKLTIKEHILLILVIVIFEMI